MSAAAVPVPDPNFMRAYPILISLLAAMPAAAAGPAEAGRVDAAQRRCFCVKFSPPGDMVPYFLMRMDWQECKGRELSFAEGRTVFEMGLLECGDLLACLSSPKKEEAAREAALKKVDDITKELLACCGKDRQDCDKACVSRLEPELNKAKARSAALERKALRRQDACIAKKPAAKPPPAPEDTPPAPPGTPPEDASD